METKLNKLKGNWLFVLYLRQTNNNKARLVSSADSNNLKTLQCQPHSSVIIEAKPSVYPLSLCECPRPQAMDGLHTLGALLSFPASWAHAPMPDGSPVYASRPPPFPHWVHPVHSVGHWQYTYPLVSRMDSPSKSCHCPRCCPYAFLFLSPVNHLLREAALGPALLPSRIPSLLQGPSFRIATVIRWNINDHVPPQEPTGRFRPKLPLEWGTLEPPSFITRSTILGNST